MKQTTETFNEADIRRRYISPAAGEMYTRYKRTETLI